MNKNSIKRIAMWSGPRNISTAMMRAWENRPDTSVVDEPFYACYLTATGVQHPMQKEVLESQSSDWGAVIKTVLSDKLASHESIQYQKHMTQHMVGEIDTEWFATLSHAFLIRHPANVVASYGEKRSNVTADDIGFEQQHTLFDLVCEVSGEVPPVIDSKDVLKNPEETLGKLCEKLGVPFIPQMLNWPAGRRESDGVWAPHWYQNVEASTGFAPYKEKHLNLNEAENRVVEKCLPHYQALYRYKL